MMHSIGFTQRNYFGLVAAAVGITAFAVITLIFLRSRAPTSQGSQQNIQPLKDKNVTNASKPTKTPEQLVALTKENIGLIKKGCYTNSQGKNFPILDGETLALTTRSYLIYEPIKHVASKNYKTEISVVKSDTLSAAQQEVAKGHQVVVLNFASPIEPGGGFTEGTVAQEEDLCYCTNLAGLMQDQINKFSNNKSEHYFFPLKQKETYDANTDHLIFTPTITVFRDKSTNYALLDIPFEVGVISAAAPCKPQLKKSPSSLEYAVEKDSKYMRYCIIKQLDIAQRNEYDCVILGAFGCGAFKNPPDSVAKIYQEVITKHFDGVFKKIVFAIIDDHGLGRGEHNPSGNIQPFLDYFSEEK